MAQHRMMSLKIIDSARFLKMPQSSQNLYFHLILRGDDDGVVEAYNVLRLCGASEDDLRILAAKGFITVLNEDLVSFINDWREHNLIRADRKVDSIYQALLVQVIPDVDLLESKQRADRPAKKEIIDMDVIGTSQGQPMDSLSKDKISKDKINEDKNNYQLIADLYNQICVSFPKVKKLSEQRKKAIKARLRVYSIDDFKTLFEMAEQSNFLKGVNNRNWSADFDWLLNDTNIVKVLEGKYNNRKENTYVNINTGRQAESATEGLVAKAIKSGVSTEFEGF